VKELISGGGKSDGRFAFLDRNIIVTKLVDPIPQSSVDSLKICRLFSSHLTGMSCLMSLIQSAIFFDEFFERQPLHFPNTAI
jgi:hypothetical protein